MFEGIVLTNLTPAALLGLTVLMLLFGKLRTNNTYLEKVQEAERWRLAYEAERETRVLANAQTTELLELAKTTQSLLASIFASSEHIRRSGEPDDLPKA